MRRTLVVTLLLLLTVVGIAAGTGTLTIPNLFTNATTDQPAALLDADFAAIATYVNNREMAFGLLANRPAASFNGRTYFATDVAGGSLYADDGSAWHQVLSSGVVRSYLAGCLLTNDTITPNSNLDVNDCVVTSDDQTTTMSLSGLIGGTLATWSVGGGFGKMDTGAVGINTWYHVYVIERTDTGVVDILFSTNATTPTMPASYTKKRRIGSFKTAAATTNILGFVQYDDEFWWTSPVLDITVNTPTTNAVTRTLPSVPLGVSVKAILNVELDTGAGGSVNLYLSDLAVTDQAASGVAAPLASLRAQISSTAIVGPLFFRTNTTQQIRSRASFSDANVNFNLAVLGWVDHRGRDN